MDIIASNMGGVKLIHEGHSYTIAKTNKDTIRLRCALWKKEGCSSSLKTDLAMTTIVPGSIKPHIHEPNSEKLEGLKVRDSIKQSAVDNRSKPSQIIHDQFDKVTKEAASEAGDAAGLRQTIRRVKKSSTPKNPSSIGDIPYPLPAKYAEELQRKMKEMCDQYAAGGVTIPQFLNQIGKCIRINKKKNKKNK